MSHEEYKHIGKPETKLIEEMAELTKELCKAERFGWFNFHPDKPDATNIARVLDEMKDVLEALNTLNVMLRDTWFEYFEKKQQ